MSEDHRFRVVACGLEDSSRMKVAASELASKLSATPKQIEQILSSSHYVLAKDLEIEAAERYAETLRGAGVIVKLEDQMRLLAIELPTGEHKSEVDDVDLTVNRLADYQRWSGFLWIGLGIIQALTVYGIIAGVWNIFAGISRVKMAKQIRARDASVPAAFKDVSGLVIIAIVNILLGGVIGLVVVGFDIFVRDKILKHRELIDRAVEKVDAYALKKARRAARLQNSQQG